MCYFLQVMVLVNNCKTCKTINSFANSVYDKLVSPGASQGMQWKSSERGADCRQGLSHLDSLLAVIGGIALNMNFFIWFSLVICCRLLQFALGDMELNVRLNVAPVG